MIMEPDIPIKSEISPWLPSSFLGNSYTYYSFVYAINKSDGNTG